MKTRLARNLALVGIIYAVGSFLLYRARVQSDSRFWDSDALVFYGPAIAALGANVFLFLRAFRGRLSTVSGLAAAIGLAFLATFVAAWCWAFIAFNRYGT